MLRLLCLVLSMSSFAYSQTKAATAWPDPSLEEDASLDPLSEAERSDELAFTQAELQAKRDRAYALDLGPVMPWTSLGLAFLWQSGQTLAAVQAGLGAFQISGNENNRNYEITLKSQAFTYSQAYHFPVLTPLYLEGFVAWVHWNGEIRPRGEDPLQDEIASALSSNFDAQGLNLGANLGFSWIFQNGFFLDYKLLSISRAFLAEQRYTYNTAEARARVEEQLQGPLAMNTMHLRLGYTLFL